MKTHLILSIFICYLAGGASGCTKKQVANEWTINFESIPQRLIPGESNINVVAYLLKQTHVPMFYESQPNQYDSRILDSWDRSSDNKIFTFCANSVLKFDNSNNFTSDNIKDSLEKLGSDLGARFTTVTEKNCVTVRSNDQMPNFLRNLTDLRYAPSIRCSDRWDCGLGSFKVSEISEDKIVLKRKSTQVKSNQFTSIVLAPSRLLVGKQISDINRSIEARPSWIKLNEYDTFSLNLLQTIVLILNIPDKEVRKALYSCIDREKLKVAFNPSLQPEQAIAIPTILPLEVDSVERVQDPKCVSIRSNKGPFHFVNWRSNNAEPIISYLKNLSSLSNIGLRSLDLSPTEFVQFLLSRKSKFKKFDIIPMALGAEAGNYSSFFRPLLAPRKKYVNYDVDGGEVAYRKLIGSTNNNESLKLARKLAAIVAENYMAVPLYQVNRTFYYPKNIANLETGSNFLEYPEVANLEIN